MNFKMWIRYITINLSSFLCGKNHMVALRHTYVLVSTGIPNLAEKSYL